MQQFSHAASSTLLRLLGSDSDSIRLRAAIAILDQANKGVEMLDFEERLSALEKQAAEEQERRGKGGRR